MLTTHTVITLFKEFDPEYTIQEDVASYILRWFFFQDKIAHTLTELKHLVDQVYHFHEDGIILDDLKYGEYTLPDIFFELGLIECSCERDDYVLLDDSLFTFIYKFLTNKKCLFSLDALTYLVKFWLKQHGNNKLDLLVEHLLILADMEQIDRNAVEKVIARMRMNETSLNEPERQVKRSRVC